jgi:glucosamine--fructose-6-phosphate aminotransferase (isomerizing)
MCGIVGALAGKDVWPVLIEGLRRLEYRGYDSAGMAVIGADSEIRSEKILGKVEVLSNALAQSPLGGHTGIAHTRWATHGKPSVVNAHPHICQGRVALVHNGIIENHETLRRDQINRGYTFNSETDSEVVVNEIHYLLSGGQDALHAVMDTVALLDGAFALGVIFRDQPGRLIAARHGSPLVIGVGEGAYYIASDIFALLPVTRRYIILEEGDIADIQLEQGIRIYDRHRRETTRPIITSELQDAATDKAGFRHYMLKEIYEQPAAISETLEGRILNEGLADRIFGVDTDRIFKKIKAVHIVACGTSFHAGLVARYWIESIAKIPCVVDIASEYRYRDTFVYPGTLFIVISQSGETADTLAALKMAKTSGYTATLTICNVAESSMTRESDLVFLTRAGMEIGVASTKAFTTQLTALMLLVMLLARTNRADSNVEKKITGLLQSLPGRVNHLLELNEPIRMMAERFVQKHHALYLGRGSMLPIAMEGALKLKEISYIHAEAYAAGELKHGPLALVDEDMPVIAVAPKNDLLKKLESNLQEVKARGGELYVFADSAISLDSIDRLHKIEITQTDDFIAPIIYTIPLQLLAYHVAVLKGADVDQPRNLAKSVTVE